MKEPNQEEQTLCLVGRSTAVEQISCPEKRTVITLRVISQQVPALIRTCIEEAAEVPKEATETVKVVIAKKAVVAVATEIAALEVVAEVEISKEAAEEAKEPLVEDSSNKDHRWPQLLKVKPQCFNQTTSNSASIERSLQRPRYTSISLNLAILMSPSMPALLL